MQDTAFFTEQLETIADELSTVVRYKCMRVAISWEGFLKNHQRRRGCCATSSEDSQPLRIGVERDKVVVTIERISIVDVDFIPRSLGFKSSLAERFCSCSTGTILAHVVVDVGLVNKALASDFIRSILGLQNHSRTTTRSQNTFSSGEELSNSRDNEFTSSALPGVVDVVDYLL